MIDDTSKTLKDDYLPIIGDPTTPSKDGTVLPTDDYFNAPWVALSDSDENGIVEIGPNPWHGFKSTRQS